MERNRSFDMRTRITGIQPPKKVVKFDHPAFKPEEKELELGGEQSQQTLNPVEYLQSSIRMWEDLLEIMSDRNSADRALAEQRLSGLKADLEDLTEPL